MEFRLLGPLEALRDDRSLPLGGAKQRGLLALLLLHPNQVVSRDRLIDELWPEREPGTAGHSLDVQVSRLRKAFEPDEPLATRSGGYALEVDPEQIDSNRFERLLESGRQANAAGQPREALEALEPALALWRGRALADLEYETFARTEIARLDELRLVATEEQIDAELALGRHDTLVPELESLIAAHPHRERLRGQLMLALYRSGRQAEALRVYADTRKRLVDELGIEPGQPLRDLEQAILRQDPALDLPPLAAQTRRRRTLVGVLGVLVAGSVTAAAVLATQGGTGRAQALVGPDSDVFLSARTDKVVRQVSLRDTIWVRYEGKSLWSASLDGELTRVDSTTGKVLATIGLGIEPAGLAVGEGSVWVTGTHSPTLYRIDPSINRVVDQFPLPMKGVVTDGTGEVAVGAGSVWVGHGAFNPGAWVERLNPETGRSEHRFSILAGDVDHLAFGGGALWVASEPSGELRKIDPRTNVVTVVRLRANLCCVAAGGGYAWAATNPAGEIWKVAPDGSVSSSIKLAGPVERLTYADGALWATLGEKGTVIRIDPTTGAVRTYAVGHSVTGVDVRHGIVAVGVRPSAADVTADLKGDVVWVGRSGPDLFETGANTDPAFIAPSWDEPDVQFQYATCGRLLNYPDAGGEVGRRLVPDIAAGFPKVSDGGRTFTFTIRKGFRFSPPSNQEVTAGSFRTAIERSLSPKLGQIGPPLTNIVGAEAYNIGKAARVSGVIARGDTLVIRFRAPEPDLPWLAAWSCAVPVGTPIVPNGLVDPVPSAGPYYLAAHTDSVAVLRRNPNYGGSRPQRVDAIVFKFNVAAGDAAAGIENGTLDYFADSDNPTLTPDTAAARAAGSRYRLTPSFRNEYLAFNVGRPLFRDIRMRRAVQYALDRRALASALASTDGGLPATRLLLPSVMGYDDSQLYPLQGDRAKARKLAAGRTGNAVVYTFVDPPYTDAFNHALREQLGAIGIHITLLKWNQENGFDLAKARGADLIWGGMSKSTADTAGYLLQLSHPTQGPSLPTPGQRSQLHRLATLSSPARQSASVALARKIERESLFAVYEQDAIPELVSKRLSCIVHQPEFAGVDIAALCLRSGRR